MQEFGSWWPSELAAASPLIQGLFALLGAALGGIVAMMTTRQVLKANLDREREARFEGRRKDREDRVCDCCERYVAILLDQVNWEQRQTDRLLQFCQRWAAGEPGLWFDDVQPDHMAELRAIELLHLPFMGGTVGSVTQVIAELRIHRSDFASKCGPNTRWTEQMANAFGVVNIRLMGRLRSLVEGAAATLVSHMSTLDHPPRA